jgi:hypothetical protein
MAGDNSTDFCSIFVSHSVGGSAHLSHTGHKLAMETIRCPKSIVHKFIILQVIPLALRVSAAVSREHEFDGTSSYCDTLFAVQTRERAQVFD